MRHVGWLCAGVFAFAGCFVDDLPARDAATDGPDLGHIDGPIVDGPVVDGPVIDGPSVDGPVVDGPIVDGPVVDGPVTDGPVTDGPVADGPVADGPIVDASGFDAAPDAPVGPLDTLLLTVLETHGNAPNTAIKILSAAAEIRAHDANYLPDFISGNGAFPGPGCEATHWGGAAGQPPAFDSIGTVTITGFTGEPLHTMHPTVTCVPNAPNPYQCDFPSGGPNLPPGVFFDGPSGAHFLTPNDSIMVSTAGGPGYPAFSQVITAADGFDPTSITAYVGNLNETNCTGDTVVQLDGRNSNPNTVFPTNTDMLVKFNCLGSSNCGVVALNLDTTNQSDPAQPPTEWVSVTCTKTVNATSGCILVPRGPISLLASHTGRFWTRTVVVRLGSGLLLDSKREIGAGRGQFYIFLNN